MNRIKIVLKEAEYRRTQKWLAHELGKTENTVSNWVKNYNQPSVEELYRIAELLDCEVADLLVEKDQITNKK